MPSLRCFKHSVNSNHNGPESLHSRLNDCAGQRQQLNSKRRFTRTNYSSCKRRWMMLSQKIHWFCNHFCPLLQIFLSSHNIANLLNTRNTLYVIQPLVCGCVNCLCMFCDIARKLSMDSSAMTKYSRVARVQEQTVVLPSLYLWQFGIEPLLPFFRSAGCDVM